MRPRALARWAFEPTRGGDADLLDTFSKGVAGRGRIVEASFGLEREIAEVGETCVLGELRPFDDHLLIDRFEPLSDLGTAMGHGPPCLFADGSVGFFVEPGHLGEGSFLASEDDGHRAADLRVFLIELGQFGLDRNIHRAEELDAHAEVAEVDRVTLLIKIVGDGAEADLLVKLERGFLELGLDVLDEVEVGLGVCLIVGVAGHVDVEVGGRLAHRRIEFAPVEDEALETGPAMQLAIDQLAVEGLEGPPVGRVETLRNDGRSGGECWKHGSVRTKGQRAEFGG